VTTSLVGKGRRPAAGVVPVVPARGDRLIGSVHQRRGNAMSSEESEEAIEVDAIDVFPDAFEFIERRIGYILRFSFLLELDVDHLITAYLTAEPRSVDMLRGGILPYLALDVRVRLVKDIVDSLGRSQDFPTLIEDIRAMFKLRNTLAHSTLVHHVKPENKVGDIPLLHGPEAARNLSYCGRRRC
jgi:hypothetical protein